MNGAEIFMAVVAFSGKNLVYPCYPTPCMLGKGAFGSLESMTYKTLAGSFLATVLNVYVLARVLHPYIA